MADGLDFIISLGDKVSGPASSMSAGLGKLASGFGSVSSALDAVAPGLGAVGGALLGVGLAAGAASVSFVASVSEMALETAELRDEWKASFGPDALAMVDKLAGELPQTTAQLAKWTTQLHAAGAEGSQLEQGVRAIAAAQAIMGAQGDQAATKVSNLLAKVSEAAQLHQPFKVTAQALKGIGVDATEIAAKMHIPVAELNKQLKAGHVNATEFGNALQEALIEKGAGPLEAMGRRLSVVFGKLKDEVINSIVETPGFKAFRSGLDSLIGIFDKNTASGKTMRAAVVGAMNFIFSAAAKVFPYVKAAILEVIIVGLKLYIALKPAGKALAELFKGGKDGAGVAKTIALISAAFTPVIAMAKVAAKGVVMFVAIFETVGGAIDSVKAKIEAGMTAIKAILSVGGSSGASGFIDGLLGGINGGYGPIVEAAKKLATGAIGALKGALGIASPSKVMALMGKHTAAGFEQGVEGGTSSAHDAIRAMATPEAASAPPTARGGSREIHLGDVHLTVNGVKDAEQLKDMLPSMLAQALEQLALESGR